MGEPCMAKQQIKVKLFKLGKFSFELSKYPYLTYLSEGCGQVYTKVGDEFGK